MLLNCALRVVQTKGSKSDAHYHEISTKCDYKACIMKNIDFIEI